MFSAHALCFFQSNEGYIGYLLRLLDSAASPWIAEMSTAAKKKAQKTISVFLRNGVTERQMGGIEATFCLFIASSMAMHLARSNE